MELEYKSVTLEINEQFQDELKKLIDDKWEVQPGTKPLAIYHLVRIKQESIAGIGGLGSLKIEESKIHIIRGGKRVRPDGTVEEDAAPGRVLDGEAKLG